MRKLNMKFEMNVFEVSLHGLRLRRTAWDGPLKFYVGDANAFVPQYLKKHYIHTLYQRVCHRIAAGKVGPCSNDERTTKTTSGILVEKIENFGLKMVVRMFG